MEQILRIHLIFVNEVQINGKYTFSRVFFEDLKIYHIEDTTGCLWTMQIIDGGRRQICHGSVQRFLAA